MESGSIDEVTERLKSWCNLHDHGLVRVEWDSAYARQEVVERLRNSLPVVEIELPPGEAGYETATRLIEKLQARSGSVVSITGVEWAFPQNGNRLETLAALSFQRETLASLPVRQIWWIPSSLTERFVLGVPDLDSWFRLRLHLTETPPRRAKAVRPLEESSSKTLSVAEARSVARRFWERLESARAQNVPEERIWTELAQPAVDALLSAGLTREADSLLASIPEARERLERALDDARAARGPEDISVLVLTNRVARLLAGQGDLVEARRLQEGVLSAMARVLGEDHPETLISMNNLAETLRAQGDLTGARQIQERVWKLMAAVLGAEHPDTLTSINNLAGTLLAQGDIGEARRLGAMVLEGRTRVLGKEHRDTLASTSNLAGILTEQAEHEGARRLQERVLDVSTRVLGEEHPDTLRSMNNLAGTLASLGDLPRARYLYGRVLEVSSRVLGEKHPRTLTSMGNLASVLWSQGERSRALAILRHCLAGQRKVLGGDHPTTVASAELLSEWESEQ